MEPTAHRFPTFFSRWMLLILAKKALRDDDASSVSSWGRAHSKRSQSKIHDECWGSKRKPQNNSWSFILWSCVEVVTRKIIGQDGKTVATNWRHQAAHCNNVNPTPCEAPKKTIPREPRCKACMPSTRKKMSQTSLKSGLGRPWSCIVRGDVPDLKTEHGNQKLLLANSGQYKFTYFYNDYQWFVNGSRHDDQNPA